MLREHAISSENFVKITINMQQCSHIVSLFFLVKWFSLSITLTFTWMLMKNYSDACAFLADICFKRYETTKLCYYTHILRQWGHLARWLVVWNWRKDRIKVSKPHKVDSSLINKCLTYHKDLIAVTASDSKLGSLQSRYRHCRRNCRGRCEIDYPFAGKRKKNYDFINSKQLTFRWK